MTRKFNEKIKEFHKVSNRHVLILEANIDKYLINKIFNISDDLRQAGNELAYYINKNFEQLKRTKKYRKLLKLYHENNEKDDSDEKEKKKKILVRQLKQMQKEYNVTLNYCIKKMGEIKNKYRISSIAALTKTEDIWSGMEQCLYGDGEKVHFSKKGEYSSIRAKQYNKSIVLKVKNKELYIELDKKVIKLKIEDQFQKEECAEIINYLNNYKEIDDKAISELETKNNIIDTFRPCYCTLIPKIIRGKKRVFVYITIEGKAKPKKDKNGVFKHSKGNGIMGIDIGTQTIAYTSDTEVGLKNLAERGMSIKTSEAKARRIQRKMDRSQRASNPKNYKKDGTVKKGPKKWIYTKRYNKLKIKHAELCRKNAVNRLYAINEDINHIRTLGDIIITEPKNAEKLKKKKNNKNKKRNK